MQKGITDIKFIEKNSVGSKTKLFYLRGFDDCLHGGMARQGLVNLKRHLGLPVSFPSVYDTIEDDHRPKHMKTSRFKRIQLVGNRLLEVYCLDLQRKVKRQRRSFIKSYFDCGLAQSPIMVSIKSE